MKKIGKITLTFLLIVAGACVAVWVYSTFFDKSEVITIRDNQPIQYTTLPNQSEGALPDLTYAAENSIHAVVHIATQTVRGGEWSTGNPLFDQFFGRRNQQPRIAQGFGSGVILSDDGYIITNNHVIEDARDVKVILNDKREFEAELIGTDPSTDIALLKIEASELPFLTYGNSDELKLGEWVLAVGNPFNLTSTVTAGIISARARNLRINEDEMAVESYIQTDAAVNPGNSGGALVNQQGQLVGINSAIASRTGSYSGYSFAVPVTIAKKVVADLKEFGEVQRALLGVRIGDIDADVAKDNNLEVMEGVLVSSVTDEGAAKEAGIKENDVIIGINGEPVNNTAELQEKISQYRPGDDIKVIVVRNGEKKQFTVTLRNKHGDTQIVRDETTYLGAEFENITSRDKDNLDIEYGIQIIKLGDGKFKDAGLKEGFIIVSVNKTAIKEVSDLKRVIGNARGGILVEGVYPNGEYDYVVFGS